MSFEIQLTREAETLREPSDRRKSERWQPHVKLLSALDFQGGELLDVSETGFRLRTPKDLPLGSFLTLTLAAETPNGPTFDIEGRIVWKKPKEIDGKKVHDMGVLLMNRRDLEEYRRAFGKSTKVTMPVRRRSQRRIIAVSSSSDADRRRRGRRGTLTIKSRLAAEGWDLDDWMSNHTYERPIESSTGPTVVIRGKTKIMLGSNNYLGLTHHPRVREAAIKAIDKYGTGAGGARALSGTTDVHKQLEERLARFKGAESCLVLPAGYLANAAALKAALTGGDVVFLDKLNHASIIDGCRATAATCVFYQHVDMGNLERKLQRYDPDRPRLIITDGVFSMEGDIAPLKEIIELKKKYNALVMVDDAHATGVIGATGRGTAEHCGVLGQADFTIATFSKAFGAVGGAVFGPRTLYKKIFYRSSPFIFTAAPPPHVCASVLAALDVIESEPQIIAALHRNRQFLRSGLAGMGYNALETPSAVIPIIIGDEDKAYQLTSLLEEMGVFVNAVAFPAVPSGTERLRVCAMATHTEEHLQTALDAFKEAGRRLGIIP